MGCTAAFSAGAWLVRYFYEEIAKEPDWITGVCFAPWEQDSIEELYEKLPEKYRENIRNYPDISHNSNCQFPVENWDGVCTDERTGGLQCASGKNESDSQYVRAVYHRFDHLFRGYP